MLSLSIYINYIHLFINIFTLDRLNLLLIYNISKCVHLKLLLKLIIS